MYFPIGWSKSLKIRLKSSEFFKRNESEDANDLIDCNENLLSIKTNSDKSFLCVLTNFSLRIWFCKPSVEIVSHFRNETSIKTFGFNKSATWKPDSSMIIIQTTLDFLLFYRIILKYDDQELFIQNNISSKRDSFEIRNNNDKIPALLLELSYYTKINSGISCIMAAEEEAIVCTHKGEILGVHWDGSIDENFNWNLNDSQYSSSNPNLNLTTDEQQSDSQLFYVSNIEYSSAIGGFSLVFANGKAAFLPLKNEDQINEQTLPTATSTTTTDDDNNNNNENNRTNDNQSNSNNRKYCIKKLHFVNDVDNAIVTSINHKYQILAFGLKNSEAILCYIDDPTNTVVITHHLSLSSSSFPNANNLIGNLNNLQWSPDSSVLAASWEKGGFVIWSVFGSLLSCSLGWDYGTSNQNKYKLNIYDSLTWAKEGYQLWTLEKTLQNSTTTTQDESTNNSLNNSLNSQFNNNKTKNLVYKTNLSQFSMVKSILASNPSCISNCGEHVLLIGEDRLYLGFEATNTHNQTTTNLLPNDENLPNDDNLPSTNTTNIQWEHQSSSLGNHQWVIIGMPPSYYNLNSPIKYASIDQTGQLIAIAGKNGFAIYSMITRKWKLFGNETQERDFEVCGGLIWFKEMIVMGCYNLIDCCFEIRVYSSHLKLDNQNAKIVKVPCDILLMSINKNHLLVYLLDGSFYLYGFYELKKQNNNNLDQQQQQQLISSSASSLSLNNNTNTTSNSNNNNNTNLRPHHLSSINKFSNQTNQFNNQRTNLSTFHLILMHQIVSNVIVPPECVTSIILSSLHSADNYSNKHQSQIDHSFNDLILMNVCGRLFLLEIDHEETRNMNIKQNQQNGNLINGLTRSMSFHGMFNNSQQPNLINQTPNNHKIPLVYKVVSVLASGVENVWVNNNSNEINEKEKRPHLSNALWLACGMRGMGVWLPLLSDDKNPNQSKSFIAKRIMLPISTHIYPLAVLFRDALVLGAENDTIFCGKSQILNKPFCHVSKTSQVYLHHILRELLKRNLGMHAFEIANSCSSLPYFPHSLELLLHGVLEEEASSSQAIPDPLLPRVIQFIREFPVFLETVVHCARKTELALWPHLFSIVGNPKDLFQQCLDSDKLSTAASYIIVLHNLEQKSISKQYATTLLTKAQEKGKQSLVKDLLRFLQNAIEPTELLSSSTNSNTIQSKVNLNPIQSSIHNSKYLITHSGSTNEVLHNQIMQLNLNKSHQIGRKRTSSTSLALQHSNSLESPHSSTHTNHPLSTASSSIITTTTNNNNNNNSNTITSSLTPIVTTTNQLINQLTNGTIGNSSSFNTNNTNLSNNTGLTTSTSSLASTSTTSINNNLSNSLNQINQMNHNPYFKNSSKINNNRSNNNNIVPPGAVTLIQKNSNYKLINSSTHNQANLEDDDEEDVKFEKNNGNVNRANSFHQNDKHNNNNLREQNRRHSIAESSSNCKLQ